MFKVANQKNNKIYSIKCKQNFFKKQNKKSKGGEATSRVDEEIIVSL